MILFGPKKIQPVIKKFKIVNFFGDFFTGGYAGMDQGRLFFPVQIFFDPEKLPVNGHDSRGVSWIFLNGKCLAHVLHQ
jgi:hypothetical protein